jgi:cell division protein FtsW
VTATLAPPRRPATQTRNVLDHPLADFYLVVASGGVIVCLGVMMVISASSVDAAVSIGDPYYYGKKQILFAILGALGAWVMSRVPLPLLRWAAWPALVVAALLSLATRVPGIGIAVNGNYNWVSLGPTWATFQPSEFAKLALVLWCANFLAQRERLLEDLRQWFLYLMGPFVIICLVGVYQHDLGSALVIAAMVIGVLFMAGAPWRLIGLIGLLGLLAAAALIVMSPNRIHRFALFLSNDQDIEGGNMQPIRSVYALASGGLFGEGLGASRQKWGLLAEAHTDYIFAIIGEELGFVGAFTVIFLFFVLGFAGIRIARSVDDVFCRHVAAGVTAWFTVQAFVNIAVVLNLIPVMGVTLPMISYGGSSLLANLLGLGLLIRCARQEPDARRALVRRQETRGER